MPSSLNLPSLIAVPPKSMPITCVIRFGLWMQGFRINPNSINVLRSYANTLYVLCVRKSCYL